MPALPPARPPMLGALLRLAHQELVNQVALGLAEAGCGDVSPAQYAVCQQLGAAPEGKRLTDLAAYAGLSKPSMSALVEGLVRSGYVERVPDPLDGRAQLIRFTARGWAFSDVAVREVQRVEQAWAARVGTDQVETLRSILQDLHRTRLERTD